jgi:hypothetical protein
LCRQNIFVIQVTHQNMSKNKKRKDLKSRYKHKGKNQKNYTKAMKKKNKGSSELDNSITTHKSIWTVKKR